MKILKIAILLIAFIPSISCHGNRPSVKIEDKKSQDSEKYNLIRMERRGGGDKLFNLSPSTSKDTLIADVFRYNFRDTSATCLIVNNAERDSAFSVYYKILEGKITILGDSVSRNNMPVGTWRRYYAVKDTTMTEITNKEVKDILSQFEWMLKEALSE